MSVPFLTLGIVPLDCEALLPPRRQPHGLHTRWSAPSLRGGPRRLPVLVCKVELSVSGQNLLDRDVTSKSALLCPLHRDGWQVDGGEARWCADTLNC